MSLSQNIEESLSGLDGFIDEILLIEATTAAAIITGAVDKMRAAGVSEPIIRQRLLVDFQEKGRLFSQFETSTKAHIAGLVAAASRLASEEVYRAAGITTNLRKWVAVNIGTDKICPDCPTRHGRIETLDVWQEIGLPGSGWSVCGPHDACILVIPSIEIGDIINV